MATSLSKAKKKFKWPGETGKPRHTIDYATHHSHMPFNPLESPYQTNAQFDEAVNTTAQGQIQPRLDDVTRRETQEGSAHDVRRRDITDIYNTNTQARKDALSGVSTALNGLITANGSLDEGTKNAMMAALRSGQARSDAVNKELGLASNPDQGQGYLQAVQGNANVGGIGLTSQFGSILGGLGRDVGISEIGRRESSDTENNRFQAIADDLSTERTQLNDELPGLRETARQNLMNTELARRGQRTQETLANEQQQLAEDQFGEQKVQDRAQRSLARRQQRETERAGRRGARQANREQTETERANRANEAINKDQVDVAKAQIIADAQKTGDANAIEEAKAKSQRFDAGVKILTEFFKPLKAEQRKSGSTKSTYDARVVHGYDSMVEQLMSATGAGPIEARQMILAAVNGQTSYGARWRARAQREIANIKINRKNQRRTATEPHGNPGAT